MSQHFRISSHSNYRYQATTETEVTMSALWFFVFWGCMTRSNGSCVYALTVRPGGGGGGRRERGRRCMDGAKFKLAWGKSLERGGVIFKPLAYSLLICSPLFSLSVPIAHSYRRQRELSTCIQNAQDKDAVEKVMNDLDSNNDGEVDFTEFIILMGALTVACNDFFNDDKSGKPEGSSDEKKE
uniref:EF-hand domain-containing protein n=1 Tax=Denticeps clupeoides TaxID=299321 RepID=A0AAY4DBC4_9TELE